MFVKDMITISIHVCVGQSVRLQLPVRTLQPDTTRMLRYREDHSARSSCLVGVIYDISLEKIC